MNPGEHVGANPELQDLLAYELKQAEQAVAIWTNSNSHLLIGALISSHQEDYAKELTELILEWRRASQAFMESMGPIEPLVKTNA